MGFLLRSPNGKYLLLTARTASHSIAMAAMETFWPNISLENFGHAAAAFPEDLSFDGTQENVGIIVRNPIERFRSMVAHANSTVEYQLNYPRYKPLPSGNFVKYFRFEDQLQECADWIGITTPLPKLDSVDESQKPILTKEQENLVKQIYANDIILWESLQIKENL